MPKMINRSLFDTAGISAEVRSWIRSRSTGRVMRQTRRLGVEAKKGQMASACSSSFIVGQSSERRLQGHCTLGVGDAKAEANQLLEDA